MNWIRGELCKLGFTSVVHFAKCLLFIHLRKQIPRITQGDPPFLAFGSAWSDADNSFSLDAASFLESGGGIVSPPINSFIFCKRPTTFSVLCGRIVNTFQPGGVPPMRTAAMRTDHERGGTASGKRVRTRRRTVSGNGCRPFAQGLSNDSWHAFTASAKTYAKTCLTGWGGRTRTRKMLL